MRARPLLGSIAAVLAVASAATPSPAHAAITFGACPDGPSGFECATLTVPLDHRGTTGAAIGLHVRRSRAASPSATAVVPLAGGPGQAASPFAAAFRSSLAAGLASRDLLVFDQRGTGRSAPLTCRALSDPRLTTLERSAACAAEIGPARAFFTTPDSVADLERLRIEGGYERLLLYGVSYGTKVALDYAARHPDRGEALILDSVVPGIYDPLRRQTFAAFGPLLRDLCRGGACEGIRGGARANLASAARLLARAPRAGSVTSPTGRRVTFRMDEDDLFGLLVAGDLNPTLRAELPGSLRAFLDRDRTPLVRLAARSIGLTGVASQQVSLPDNDVLFLTTRCEETPFPWDRAADRSTRLAQAQGAVDALPTSAFAPFSRGAGLRSDMVPICASWPVASPAPAPDVGALPTVPTLIIEGSADARTPTASGAAIAARIPGARLLTVPWAGHSVLGTEPGDCAARAVTAFLSGPPVADCAAIRNPFSPTPKPPTRLARVRGTSKARRTVTAVLMTMTDVRRQIIGDALATGTGVRVGSQTGGLRAGYARVTRTGTRLRGVAYVPGVRVTGFVPDEGTATVTVRGGGAARGTLRVTRAGAVSGTLDGRRVRVPASAAARTAFASAVGPLPRRARPLAALGR